VAQRVKKTLKKLKPKKKKSDVGGWHYQVVHRTLPNDEDWFAIHEAHLNDAGEIFAITENPMPAQAGTLESVKRELKQMLEDAEEYGVFDYEGPFAKLERGKSIPFKWSRKKPAKKKRPRPNR